MSKKVVIGMSGGVDSAVAALLLKKDGFDVVGLFMHNWEEEEGGVCTSADDWQDVQSVCSAIDIPCYSVNFAKQYLDGVFDYFLNEYKKLRTPNPDVLCNRVIKFGIFKDYAMSIGADLVATGHYCRTDGARLMCAKDEDKDQTYFLNQVQTEQLSNVLFPIGGYKKSEIRAIAESAGLSVSKKKDSTGVCFIGERKFKQFLQNFLPAKTGEIVDKNGTVIGTHDGLMYYTIGQRRGLGVGGVKGETGRWYVVGKDVENNRLVVSCGDESDLMTTALFASGLNVIGDNPLTENCTVYAKTRYRQKAVKAVFSTCEKGFRLVFSVPMRAVTPGQYCVLYDGDTSSSRCIGGGTIENAYNA